MKKLFVVFIALMLAFACACAQQPDEAADGETADLNEPAGTETEAETTESLVVEESDFNGAIVTLPEDKESGYGWIVQLLQGSGSVSLTEQHDIATADSGFVSPGMVTYGIAGEAAGKMQIGFYYVPEGGEADDAAGSAIYTVSIGDSGSVIIVDEELELPEF